MALSVKNKQSFGNSQHSHAKMCLQDQIKRSMAAPSVSWPTPMRAIGAQNLLTMPGGMTTSGYLHKKGGSQFSLLKWPLRFIIIHKGCVYYFKSSTSATPQGAFSLKGYNRILRAAEETTSSNVFPFKIVHFSKTHRTWYFSAASEDERRKWMRHLRKEIDHYNDKRELQIPSSDDSDAESVYGPLEEPVEIIDFEDDYEADYMTQDEDSDGEDNHKQDQPPVPPGRPMVPPPPYPPPPVPHLSRENRQTNRPPPPLPPSLKKPPCCIPLNKGPPPPLPFAPHLQKPDIPHRSSAGPMPVPASFATIPLCERKPKNSLVGNTATTLPIVENLEKVVLNPGNKPPTSSNHLGSKTHLAQIPKPPIPTKPKPSRPSLQRASPDGQSFRSSLEENPLNKRFPQKSSEDSDVDDDGYENVQLPPSVFVETTETSSVERLFKETYSCPLNGLYCIRKSGTGKTSQVLVVWDVNINKARNYRLFKEDQRVYVETEVTFPTLDALVEHYYINALPSSHNSLPHSSLCLQIPYGYNPPR